jgi:hypothetical protein
VYIFGCSLVRLLAYSKNDFGSDRFLAIPANSFMHRLSSHYVLRRFKITSLFVVLMFLSLPLAVGCVLYGWYADDAAWMKNAGIILAAGLVLKVLAFIIGERLKCPLCMATPLRSLGCAKHRSAQALYGSHKLAVATSVLFEGNFRCPYCGEMTGMHVRERSSRRDLR